MRACSACAGEYEDPEHTAWSPDEAEDEEEDGAGRESFQPRRESGGNGGDDAENSEK